MESLLSFWHSCQRSFEFRQSLIFHMRNDLFVIYLLKEGIAIIEELKREYEMICKHIDELSNELRTLPAGSLSISSQGTRTKWYISRNLKTKYLPKCEQKQAEDLAWKKYLEMEMRRLVAERKVIGEFLKKYPCELGCKVDDFISEKSPYSALIRERYVSSKICFKDMESQLAYSEWANEEYDANPRNIDRLKYESVSGRLTRSKSEAIIDSALFRKGLAFRYECKFDGCDFDYYPDFTIRHPKTLEIHYWEHFGLMEDPAYRENARRKINMLADMNIFPGDKLIVTYESKDRPFTPKNAENVINYYFGV